MEDCVSSTMWCVCWGIVLSSTGGGFLYCCSLVDYAHVVNIDYVFMCWLRIVTVVCPWVDCHDA